MTLIRAVDVSSWQEPSADRLAGWIADGCQLLLIRAYTVFEGAALRDVTRAWVALARDYPIWHLPYCWLYGSNDPSVQAESAVDLWRMADGAVPPLMAFDCEYYAPQGHVQDDGPSVEQYLAAAARFGELGGLASVLYSNPSWLRAMQGDTGRLNGSSGWLALYNGRQDLNVPNALNLEVIGHQYTDQPEDWSVFDLERLTELVTPPTPWDPCAALQAQLAAALDYVNTTQRLRRRDLRALLSPR